MSSKSRLSALCASAALVCLTQPAGAALSALSPQSAPAPRPAAGIAVAMTDAEAFGLMGEAVKAYQPPGDLDYLPKVLQAYRAGDLAEADILRSKLTDPAALAVADWFALRGGIGVSMDRLASFRRDNPDWPVTSGMRRRAEETLLSSKRQPARVRALFQNEAPASGAGRIALAFALKADGAADEAGKLIRAAWREDSFGPELEGRILDEFPDVLTRADHRFRMERLLFKEAWGGALRAAGHAGGDYKTLVQARMGLFQGKKKAEKAFAAVPAALRTDSSFIFSKALYLRRQNKFAEAAQVMAQAPRDPDILVDGDEWWNERRRIVRELLDKGEAKTAYAVAAQHGAETPSLRIEAEFHAGWIALRFLDDPALAAKHFAEASSTAVTPISVARATYWQGRAAESAGQKADARLYYARAADRPTTFYGQLAREKLDLPVELRRPERLDEGRRLAFEKRVPIRAVRLLKRLGEDDLALSLYGELAQNLADPAELDALASIAEENQNPRALLVVGKTAVQRGFPLDVHAYPTIGIPAFAPVGAQVDPAMVYAIARQESAFNPKAISSAGARGLMQLMPATAARTAKRFGVSFDVKRLVEDPAYNAKIGSAHLSELMADWKGSHILAFASYNAGGGNVMKWVNAYGDPRKSDVDWVDWVERIPFQETRNYVQRVMENLVVYRHRLSATATANALPPEPKGDTQY